MDKIHLLKDIEPHVSSEVRYVINNILIWYVDYKIRMKKQVIL